MDRLLCNIVRADVLALSLLLTGTLVTPSAQARERSPAASREANEASLADAIRIAAPSQDLAIAVGAEKVKLAAGTAMPEQGLPLSQTVTNFGYTTRRFGAVVAIAPQRMVILASALGPPDVYKDIPPREAFALLAASLTEGQRQLVLSEQGLGVGDLTTPMQRGLFLTLFHTDHLSVRPRAIPGQSQPGADQERDIPSPMQNARLRIGSSLRMIVHSVGQDTPGLTPVFADEKGPRVYDVANQKHLFSADTVDGARVRWVEDNMLKKGQLNFEAPALQQRVSLGDVKTVGDIIARTAAQTKLELYADRRYEGRSATILNASGTAKASDLLRALCICVTGAFRRVGPAFVLTDDLAGVGSRRQKIIDFQADADAQRATPLQQAEDYLQNTGAFWRVRPSGFGDPLLPTADQMKREDRNILGAGAISVIKLPVEQLTPPQRQALQQYSGDLAKLHDEHPNDGYSPGVDFDKDIELNVQPSVQLLLPGLDGPIDTDLGQFVAETFHDMSKFRRPRSRDPKLLPAASPSGPPLSELTSGISRRALLANARSPEELDNIVAKMRRMGLNQLWLPVFSNGIAAIPGTPFPSQESRATDLLEHAVKITRSSDIAIYPVLDLLTWGISVPRDAADLTITGETSAQDAERRRSRTALRAAAYGDPAPEPASRRLTVSPLAAPVPHDLTALVKAVASRSGIAGFIWRETCPPGYDLPDTVFHIEPHGRLGYTEAARLAFLREAHADPIDITPRRGFSESFERADTSLPSFDDYGIDQLLDQQWKKYCARTNVELLTRLHGAAAGSHAGATVTTDGNKPPARLIFVRERGDNFGTTWYGAWGGPNTLLPTNRMNLEESGAAGDLKPAAEAHEQARSQSGINLIRLPTGSSLEEAVLLQQWGQALRDLNASRNWDGFVFEMKPLP